MRRGHGRIRSGVGHHPDDGPYPPSDGTLPRSGRPRAPRTRLRTQDHGVVEHGARHGGEARCRGTVVGGARAARHPVDEQVGPRAVDAAAGLAADEGRVREVLTRPDPLAVQAREQELGGELSDAVVVRVDRREPRACPRAAVGVVEPDERLVARQHEPRVGQCAQEADRVAVGARDRRGRVEPLVERDPGGRRAGGLLVVARPVDPLGAGLDPVGAQRCLVRGVPLRQVVLARVPEEPDPLVPVLEEVLDGGTHPARVVGRDHGSPQVVDGLADDDQGLARPVEGAQHVVLDGRRDHDDPVHRVEPGDRPVRRLVGELVPVEVGRVRLDRDHAMPARAQAACDPCEDLPEVEAAHDRREDTDREVSSVGRDIDHGAHPVVYLIPP
ncbi:hypothetical protein D3C74_319640 [compost metagenome]